MGDVNFLFRSKLKINALIQEVGKLEELCNFVKDILKDNSLTQSEELNLLTILNELYDVRILCLGRLKALMISRYNFLSENR
jgi:hypothetical protein